MLCLAGLLFAKYHLVCRAQTWTLLQHEKWNKMTHLILFSPLEGFLSERKELKLKYRRFSTSILWPWTLNYSIRPLNAQFTFVACSFLTHIYFALLPSGAHLRPLIGRLILLFVSSTTCRKDQTDSWWNATELQNTEKTAVWLCGQMSLIEHRVSDKQSITCLNCEQCKIWKPPLCREGTKQWVTVLSSKQRLLAQSWAASVFLPLGSQSFTASSLVFAQGRAVAGMCVVCTQGGLHQDTSPTVAHTNRHTVQCPWL